MTIFSPEKTKNGSILTTDPLSKISQYIKNLQEITTLVITKLRWLIALHGNVDLSTFPFDLLIHGKQAKVVKNKICKALEPYKDRVNSITFDNGLEFFHHKKIGGVTIR